MSQTTLKATRAGTASTTRWMALALAVFAVGSAAAQPYGYYGYPYGPPPPPRFAYRPGPPPVVRCESNNWQNNFCPIDMRNVGSVQVIRQFSERPCVEGQNWNRANNGIWVKDGCRADFVLAIRPPRQGDSNAGYYGPNQDPRYGNGRWVDSTSRNGPPPGSYGPQGPNGPPPGSYGPQYRNGPPSNGQPPSDSDPNGYGDQNYQDSRQGTVTVRDADQDTNGSDANSDVNADNGMVNGHPPVDANGYPVDANGNRIK